MSRPLIIVVVIVVILLVIGGALAFTGFIPGIGPQKSSGGGPAVSNLPTSTPIPTIAEVPVVISVQPLKRGQKIPKEGALAVVNWPLADAPNNGVQSIDQAIGKIIRTDVQVEEPILSSELATDLTDLSSVGSDAAAVLPAGMAAISIPIDRLSDVAYAVQDGDCVDVVVSFLFVDVDVESQTILPNKLTLVNVTSSGLQFLGNLNGRIESSSLNIPEVVSPSEAQRPRLVTRQVISGAVVVHSGTFPPDGIYLGKPAPTPTPIPQDTGGSPTQGPPPPTPVPPYPDIITLGVSLQDAVSLTWFVQANIPMTLILRSVHDSINGQCRPLATRSVDFQYLLTNYGVTSPGKPPYALEPALRSIRSITLGSTTGQ